MEDVNLFLMLLVCVFAAYFQDSLERRLKLEVILHQLENDSDRDVRASTNVAGFTDDSKMDETLDTNRTSYLDETIECEPSVPGLPEVVVLGDAVEEDEAEQQEPREEQCEQEAGPSEETAERDSTTTAGADSRP